MYTLLYLNSNSLSTTFCSFLLLSLSLYSSSTHVSAFSTKGIIDISLLIKTWQNSSYFCCHCLPKSFIAETACLFLSWWHKIVMHLFCKRKLWFPTICQIFQYGFMWRNFDSEHKDIILFSKGEVKCGWISIYRLVYDILEHHLLLNNCSKFILSFIVFEL